MGILVESVIIIVVAAFVAIWVNDSFHLGGYLQEESSEVA